MKFKILLCLTLGFFAAGCAAVRPMSEQSSATAQTSANETDLTREQSSERAVDFPAENVELPKAINVSTAAQDVELARKIDEAIEKSRYKNARWGVFAVSLKDGRVVVARDAQKLFNPASTQKLFTTAVALDKLGADYRWKTSVLAANDIGADGTLNGDLFLKGRGAPDFDEESLQVLVDQLKQKGLRRVAGNVVGDASFFHAKNLGDGWAWDETQWYYAPELSALSFSDNTLLVELVPGEGDAVAVKTTPAADFVKVNVNAKYSPGASTATVGIQRKLDANEFAVWGEVPRGKSFGVRTTMHAPELWAANALKKSLEKAGITVSGAIGSQNWQTATVDTNDFKELAAIESEPLHEIVKRTNKRSINLNAELMLRTIGAKTREGVAAENQKRMMTGDDLLGAQTIKSWLAQKGVATGETEIHDGSGLSRLNFISPEIMGRLLVHATRMRDFQAFKDSLPVAGTDGTLGGRLPKFKDRVFAKTGTITYVNALAGYAQVADDETLAFVILCNNETSKENSVGTVDQVANLIAGIYENSDSK